jgi:hypothetical protein
MTGRVLRPKGMDGLRHYASPENWTRSTCPTRRQIQLPVRVLKAATSKAEPRQKQYLILRCLEGEPFLSRPCGVATLCCSPREPGPGVW